MRESDTTFAKEGFASVEATELEGRCLSVNSRQVKLFKEAVDLAHQSFLRLRIPSNDIPGLYAACLFVRLLEVCQAIVLLSARGLRHDAQALLRASVEALLRLKAVCTDEILLQRVFVSDARSRMTFLRSALEGALGDLTEEMILDLEQRKQEVEEFLRRTKMDPISTAELANSLGESRLYDTLFRFTSQFTHLSLAGLEEYFERDSAGRPHRLRYEPRHSHFGLHVTAAAEALLDGVRLILQEQSLEIPLKEGEIRAELLTLDPSRSRDVGTTTGGEPSGV